MKRVALSLTVLSLLTALVAVTVTLGSSPALAHSTQSSHMAQTYATPVPTVASSTGTMSTTTGTTTGTTSSTTGIVYSPAHPAPVVPAGAVVIAERTTTIGTEVEYQSGALYYHVRYFPSGRYLYRVTGFPTFALTGVPSAASVSTTTLPTTGGATPNPPSIPMLLVLVGITLTTLGISTRRLARRGR
jgi:hypothetical protein